MKKTFSREQVETVVCILALGWLSLLCMFVKYDWDRVASAFIRMFN